MAYEKQTWVIGDVVTAAKLNHMEDGIATGGTGGGGVFYVDATLATDGTAGTPSKTFAETLSAYEAGQNIMVRFDFSGMMTCICWLMMYMTYEGTSAFGFIGYIDNHFAQVAFMSNDTITVSPLTQQNGN